MALILANWRRASHRHYLKLVSRVEGNDRGYFGALAVAAGPWAGRSLGRFLELEGRQEL